MPTPGDIQRKASVIHGANDECSRGKERCQRYISESSTWWEGDTAKAFRTSYNGIQTDLTKFMTKMSDLKRTTTKLSNNVQRADDERRQKAEE